MNFWEHSNKTLALPIFTGLQFCPDSNQRSAALSRHETTSKQTCPFKTIYCSRGLTQKKTQLKKKRVLQEGEEARGSSLHANKFPATIYSSNGARWCAERKIELIFRGESALRGSLSNSTGLMAHGSQAMTTFILNNLIHQNKRE